MNADGTNQRRLTTDDLSNHFYGNPAPDGQSIVFSSNQTGAYEIYEMDLIGNQQRLTNLGETYAPEISPDGQTIVFAHVGETNQEIWIMGRNGNNPHRLFGAAGLDALDPTWSPDGTHILFAMGYDDNKALYTIWSDGSGVTKLSDKFTTRGRSDWSPSGSQIAGYTGGKWQRRIFIMNSDGSDAKEILSEGSPLAPSFSPDNGWIVFTGYIDYPGVDNGCEIYTLRFADYSIQRLTNNDFCDYQPRWAP
jgi:TolB protein